MNQILLTVFLICLVERSQACLDTRTTVNFQNYECPVLHQISSQECPSKCDRHLYHIEQRNCQNPAATNCQCPSTTNTECSCVSEQQKQNFNCVPVNSVTQCSSALFNNQYYSHLYNIPPTDTEFNYVSKQKCDVVPQCPSGTYYSNLQLLNAPTTNTEYGSFSNKQQLLNYIPFNSVSQCPCGCGANNNPQLNVPVTNTECGCVSKQQQLTVPQCSAGTCNNNQLLCAPNQQRVDSMLFCPTHYLVPISKCSKMLDGDLVPICSKSQDKKCANCQCCRYGCC